MCFVKYLTKTFSVDLPAKINNPVPAIKYDFSNSVSLIAFESKAATSTVIVGHSGNDLEFYIDCTFRASVSLYSALAKCLTLFHFSPITVGRGASLGD